MRRRIIPERALGNRDRIQALIGPWYGNRVLQHDPAASGFYEGPTSSGVRRFQPSVIGGINDRETADRSLYSSIALRVFSAALEVEVREDAAGINPPSQPVNGLKLKLIL
jgi:hypothetical protein